MKSKMRTFSLPEVDDSRDVMAMGTFSAPANITPADYGLCLIYKKKTVILEAGQWVRGNIHYNSWGINYMDQNNDRWLKPWQKDYYSQQMENLQESTEIQEENPDIIEI